MKNKMMKILGIALTLAVLIGLLIPAIPASAGTMTWTNTDMPTNLTQATDINVVAFAPDGKTVFIYDTNVKLSKSTNAGASWLPPDQVGIDLDGAQVVAIAVSPRYATDSVVIAVSPDNLYYSRNGGKEFNVGVDDMAEGWKGFADALGSAGTITSVAISYNWDDTMAIAVGTDAGILMYIGEGWGWVDDANIVDNNVLALAFAPDYANNDKVIAVVDNATTALYQASVADDSDINGAGAGEWVKTADFYDSATVPVLVSADAAFLAFPSDYDTDDNAIVFVGLNALDVSRVDQNFEDVAAASTNLRLNKKDAAPAIFGLSYKGTASAGTLAVGLDTQIWTSTNADTVDGSATWSKPKKLATGQNFIVAFSPTADDLYAASSNAADNFGSAFFVSPDYTYFNGISRISVDDTSYAGLTLDKYSGIGESTQYVLVMSLTTNVSILMKSTDSGKTWTEIYADADTTDADFGNELNDVSIAGDIYLVSNGADLRISSDGGNTFTTRTLRHNINAFGPSGPGEFFYADGGDIYKSTSDRTPVAELDDFIVALIPIPTFFIVATGGGPLYFSGDFGVTFKELRDLNPVSFTFDIPNRTIYAVDANVLYSYNVDTSTEWTKGKDIAPVDGDVIKIALSGDGAMYAQVDVGDSETDYQMYRSVDFNAPMSFEPIPGSAAEDVDALVGTFSTNPGPLDLVGGTTGNTIYKVTALDDNVGPGKGLSVKIKQFTDTMVTAPTGVAPVADAQVPSQPMFQWTAVVGGQNRVEYEIEVTTTLDARGSFVGDVKSINNAGDTTTALSTSGIALVPGETYYWHVRAAATEAAGKALTLSSKWSTTTKFLVKLSDVNPGDSTWIAPAAGATGVSQTPNFQWASVPRATGYELVIDGGAPIALTDPVYTLTTPLAYGSTHTWKVRAISAGTASDWVSGIFTVMAPPVTSTTTTAPKFFDANSGQYFDSQAQLDAFQAAWKASHTPTPAPSTPAYIWVIIVIAAILVIAVIVLIARTRRV